MIMIQKTKFEIEDNCINIQKWNKTQNK